MTFHKVKAVEPLPDYMLSVQFEDGAVKAQLGTPEELRNQPGLFREIDRIQSLSREEESA